MMQDAAPSRGIEVLTDREIAALHPLYRPAAYERRRQDAIRIFTGLKSHFDAGGIVG